MVQEPSAPPPSTGRLEAFSDGIIAIAATLLVLELHVPEPGDDVAHAVAAQLPSLAGFVVSFLTILVLWVNHHALFHAVERVDRPLLFLNGLLLLGISFVSFPTAVLGRALEGGGDARPAAVLYGVTFALTAGCFSALWWYLGRRPELLVPGTAPRAALRRSLVGPALYGLSVLVGLLSAPAALVVAALIPLYFTLAPGRVRRPARSASW